MKSDLESIRIIPVIINITKQLQKFQLESGFVQPFIMPHKIGLPAQTGGSEVHCFLKHVAVVSPTMQYPDLQLNLTTRPPDLILTLPFFNVGLRHDESFLLYFALIFKFNTIQSHSWNIDHYGMTLMKTYPIES